MINNMTRVKFLSAAQWQRILDLIYKKPQLIPVRAENKQPVIAKRKNNFIN
ncbi:MAG: hypothetical protein ACM3H8_12185 [Sphingobacteriales bacterium]